MQEDTFKIYYKLDQQNKAAREVADAALKYISELPQEIYQVVPMFDIDWATKRLQGVQAAQSTNLYLPPQTTQTQPQGVNNAQTQAIQQTPPQDSIDIAVQNSQQVQPQENAKPMPALGKINPVQVAVPNPEASNPPMPKAACSNLKLISIFDKPLEQVTVEYLVSLFPGQFQGNYHFSTVVIMNSAQFRVLHSPQKDLVMSGVESMVSPDKFHHMILSLSTGNQ